MYLTPSKSGLGRILRSPAIRTENVKLRKMTIKYLSSDYDGTISPLSTSRDESRVPLETRVMLGQIGRFIPISIITMKDLPFIIPRTPFARAWSGIGGLEMRIGKRVVKREWLEQKLPSISQAIDYAKSHITDPGVEIEEKEDSEGHRIAFCVDWRKAKDLKTAKQEVEHVANCCKELGLILISCDKQPFYDVYPIAPDKGWALQEMLNEVAVKNGVLYMGDSETDNPAFRVSGVSIGILHSETDLEALDCDYLIEFRHVPDFLNALLINNFLFSPDFPMIKNNPLRTGKY